MALSRFDHRSLPDMVDTALEQMLHTPILCVTFRTEQAFFVTKTRCQVISMDRHHEFIPDDWPFHENANVRFLRVRHPRPTRVRVLHIARDEEVASSHTHPFIRTVGAVISSRKSEGR